MEIDSRVLLHSVPCLGLVLEIAEEPISDSHLTMLKPLGAVCQTAGYPRARSPQLPSASSWSGVSLSSMNSSLIKRLCLFLQSAAPSQISGGCLLAILLQLCFLSQVFCRKGKFKITKKKASSFLSLK